MILYVWKYDNDAETFEKVAVIDYAISVIWIRRFQTTGQFELYLPASAELLELFSGEIFITRDNIDTAMSVEYIHLTTDAENGDYLTISGRSAECIISRRIVPKQTVFSGTAENCIRYLLTENIVSPGNAQRKINVFSLGTAQGFTETIEKQVTGKNLLTTISDICAAYDYGFKVTFTGTGFVFDLYKGTDRSLNQTENPYVIFSPEFENLGNTEYKLDKTTYYNSVFVAGEGEGTARKIAWIPPSYGDEGLRLREKWVDARNMSSDDGEISPTDYMQMLYAQCYEELALSKETTTFNGEILDVNVYAFGVDYNLGDTVSIVNEYGVTGTAVVTEITEVEDENGYKIYPTLSEWSV